MCIVGAEQCPANIVNVCCSGASKSCIGGACVSSNIDNLDLVNHPWFCVGRKVCRGLLREPRVREQQHQQPRSGECSLFKIREPYLSKPRDQGAFKVDSWKCTSEQQHQQYRSGECHRKVDSRLHEKVNSKLRWRKAGAQGRSTKTSRRCGGLGPVGCQ